MYKSYRDTQIDTSVSLSRPIRGSRFLRPGSYKLTIIDTEVADNVLYLWVKDVTGLSYKQDFSIKKNGCWSPRLRGLLATLLPNLECQQYLATVDSSDWANLLIGLSFDADVVMINDGYEIRYDAYGYYAVSLKNGTKLSGVHNKVRDLKKFLAAKNLKPGYTRLDNFNAYRQRDKNVGRFIDGIHKTQEGRRTKAKDS